MRLPSIQGCPVFDRLVLKPCELARIVRDKRQAKAARVGGDEEVVGSNHGSARPQVSTNSYAA